MPKFVVIQNDGDVAVPVGGQYLMPGEQRTVLEGHFQAARAIHPEAIVEAKLNPPADEVQAADESETQATPAGEGRLTNLTFVIAGSLPGWTQAEAEAFITGHGGQVVDSVGIAVDALVTGENPGRKLEQAKKANIPVIDRDTLLEMAGVIMGEPVEADDVSEEAEYGG